MVPFTRRRITGRPGAHQRGAPASRGHGTGRSAASTYSEPMDSECHRGDL